MKTSAAAAGGGSPAPLRVAHIVLGLQVGGLERVVVDLVNNAAPGYRPLVLCLESAGPLAAEIRREGVPVVALHRRGGLRPWLALRLRRLLEEHRVDLVHTHNTTAGFYGALAGRLAGVPVLHTKHGANLTGARVRGLNRLSFLMTDHVVAVSPATGDLARREGVDPARLSLIDNGIEVDRFNASPDARNRARRELGLPQQGFVVGTVSRLVEVKNQGLLLEAFSSLSESPGEPPGFLVLVGDGPLREKLERHAEQLPGRSRIVFAGARSQVEKLLPALDVFVLCSDFEGLPVALLEAMAASVPPVVTRVGAMPAVVVDGGAGLVVECGDRGGLAQALETLRDDDAGRRRLGEAARRRVGERYAAARMARDYEALYVELTRRETAQS